MKCRHVLWQDVKAEPDPPHIREQVQSEGLQGAFGAIDAKSWQESYDGVSGISPKDLNGRHWAKMAFSEGQTGGRTKPFDSNAAAPRGLTTSRLPPRQVLHCARARACWFGRLRVKG